MKSIIKAPAKALKKNSEPLDLINFMRLLQPLTRVSYEDAIKHVGKVFVEQQDICELTNKGSCGA